MILFELRCALQHHFEAWFRDGAAYEAQSAEGAIACPVCGDKDVSKAPMAPRLVQSRGDSPPPDFDRVAGDVRRALLEIKKQVQQNCDYVGDRFPEEARRIHYGESDVRPIYGEATHDEARDLHEEGVAVHPLPWISDAN
ncbi:DUF1178 family protein [Magnetospirillum molischianum]|uniref:DUF1178 family protein n=1 Tax=Magnetospirillum molischianum DSM 120 TaxID=1150626 RepID=H8FTM8_MAGML|nr:DUF1178 family protein [Magnetospirillum molischianum]CCG41735.1 conserved hypothetical protein [Magnetospirillum molischianum DSM 120]